MTGRGGPFQRVAARSPAHAGTFYAARPSELLEGVEHLLEAAPAGHEAPRPLGLLVPHAGLQYSGAIAAQAWALLRGAPPASVVILGTNHTAGWLDGVAIWARGAWITPLGAVEVDEELADAIADLGGPFVVDHTAHVEEHSIEVQLPILQRVAPAARIVPLLVGCADRRRCRAAAAQLGELLRSRSWAGMPTTLVASSDFAHYPSAARAEAANATLLEPILALDDVELERREDALRGAGIPGLVCGLCGIDPVLFALAALRAMGAARGRVLASGTSADAGGPRDRTVGYAAVAFGA